MEEIKIKSEEEYEHVELVVVEPKKNWQTENKILKVFTSIILTISNFVLKLAVIVAIYSVIFSIVAYYSNQYVVTKLRESEAKRKSDPVLEELRKDKDNAQKREDEEEKDIDDNKKTEKNDKKEDKTQDAEKIKNETSSNKK